MGACCSLDQLNVSGREQTGTSVTLSLPPALVNHLYVVDYVVWIEGDLVIGLCVKKEKQRIYAHIKRKNKYKQKHLCHSAKGTPVLTIPFQYVNKANQSSPDQLFHNETEHLKQKMESLTSNIVINGYCLLATCQVFIVVLVSWEIKYARLMISSHERGPD